MKPPGIDYGPMISAAEQAVETGDLQTITAVLVKELEHAAGERLPHVQELRKATKEPTGYDQVAAARQRISAELGFITFAEGMRQAVLGKSPLHHEE